MQKKVTPDRVGEWVLHGIGLMGWVLAVLVDLRWAILGLIVARLGIWDVHLKNWVWRKNKKLKTALQKWLEIKR